MLKVLNIFFRAEGTNPWMVLTCLLLAGVFGGIGFASLLPLVALATGEGRSDDSIVTEVLTTTLNSVGLELGIVPLLFMVVGAMIMKSLLSLVAARYFASAASIVVAGLRGQLLKQLLNVQWGYFSTNPLGRFANSMSFDALRSGKAYTMAANFISTCIQTVVFIGVAFVVSWKLTLIALCLGAAIAASLQFLVRRTKKAGQHQTQRTLALVVFLTDALNNIKPLKAMAKQGHFANLCDRKIIALKNAMRRQIVSLEDRRNLNEILMAISLGVAFYGAVVVASYPLSEFLVMGVLLGKTMDNVGRIQEGFQKAISLESPYYAMKEVTAEARAAAEDTGGRLVPTFNKSVKLESVDFSFDQRAILTDVNLEIPKGQITVLTGPSGAGKTTITDLILKLYRPSRGRILVDDAPLEELNLAEWRRMIGYAPQELILFHDSVFANVALGNDQLGEAEVRSALEAAGAWEFVSAMPEGMMSTVGEKGTMLSGGQRQRIALARALATKPQLLILDEVTSALDPETEADICSLIRTLSKDMGIVAITHRPAFLEIADSVYRLQDGSVETMDAAA